MKRLLYVLNDCKALLLWIASVGVLVHAMNVGNETKIIDGNVRRRVVTWSGIFGVEQNPTWKLDPPGVPPSR